jgi:polyhydroxyalkanoate synthesis regulator phasin
MLKLLFFSMLISFNLWASDVDRTAVSSIIDTMVKSGQISEKDAQAAKAELSSMSDADWQMIVQRAHKVIEKSPELKEIHQKAIDGNPMEFDGSSGQINKIKNAINSQ